MAYHNAVTDKLVVVSFLESTAYLVYSVANQLKWSNVDVNASKPKALENAFFSLTHFVSVNANFTLLPINQTSSEEVFKLQHGVPNALHSFIQDEIHYTFNHNIQQENHFKAAVAPQLELDVPVLSRNKPQRNNEDQLLFYLTEDILTICSFKRDKLQIANRYEVGNADELFYYIMLVVETLNLQPEELDVYAIATKDDLEGFNSLFKNYLKPIQQISEQNAAVNTQELIAHYLSQCVL